MHDNLSSTGRNIDGAVVWISAAQVEIAPHHFRTRDHAFSPIRLSCSASMKLIGNILGRLSTNKISRRLFLYFSCLPPWKARLILHNTLVALQLLHHLFQTTSARSKEAKIWPTWLKYLGQVFGVELDSHKPWMVFQLQNLHSFSLVVFSNEIESIAGQLGYIGRVDLEAMTMTFMDHQPVTGISGGRNRRVSVHSTHLTPSGTWLEMCRSHPETHCGSHRFTINFGHEDDDWINRLIID